MDFREYQLPTNTSYRTLDEVPEDTKQILDIYDAINGHSELETATRANELLDEFEDQQCYIVEDDEDENDTNILAVANYRKQLKDGYAWLEGLAVHPLERKQGLVGRFAINNLVEVTRESGLHEIRLLSVPSAVSFYQRHGFLVVAEDGATGDAKMSRVIR